jgi:cell shape-determining protein MreC
MTPQFVAGIFSLAGAFFFAGAGFFLASYIAELGRGKLEKELQAVNEREESIREKGAQENLSLKKNISTLKRKNNALKRATQKRIEQLKAHIKRLKSVLMDYNERLADLAVDVTRSDSERILLAEALEDTRKDIKDISDLKQKNKDLKHELDLLKSQLKDIDRLNDENQSLNEQLAELDNLKKQVEAMKGEKTRTNNALKFAEELVQLKASSSKENISPEIYSKHESLGETFQSIVNQISKLEGSCGVAVADMLGLLIAGIGDHMDSMAGMAAVYSELDNKISSLIPFGSIDMVKITNIHNLTFAMQPFEMDSEKLILTTLAKGHGIDYKAITQLIKQNNQDNTL